MSNVQAIFFDLGDTLVKNGNTKTWISGAESLLAGLKHDGFRLGIISNTGNLASQQDVLDILPNNFDITVFDPALVLFSSLVGIEKPKRGIFDKAVTNAGVPAGNCLYCSENIVETLVAQLAIEAFHKSVLPRTARLDINWPDVLVSQPFHHRCSREFCSIIGSNKRGLAIEAHQS